MTAAIKQLADDWEKLARGVGAKWRLPKLATTRLRVDTRICETRDEVQSRVVDLETTWSGWSRRESRVERCGPGFQLRPDDAGAPLDGEWVSPDGGQSIRLLYDGRRWRLITLAEGDGEPVLREDVTLVAARPKDGAPCYAVYWGPRPGDPSGLARLATRFLGFATEHRDA